MLSRRKTMYPDPLFYVFGKGVYLYGICIGVGILVCLIVFFLYTKKKGMPSEIQDFTFFVAVAAIALGFLCAKLCQAVYDWIEKGYFDFYHSGITVMGGLVGGAAVFILCYFVGGKYYFKNENKSLYIKEFNKTLLAAPCCITIAHAFGRIGCLMAGCCYGKEATSGFVIYNHGAYRIPTQLYEALFLLALFVVLSVLYFKRCNCTMQIYLIAYGVWRMIIEFFRDDPRGAVVLGLEPSQWQSILFVGGGIAMFVFYIIKGIPLFFPKDSDN